MKKIYLFSCLVVISTSTYAQNISYNQLQTLFTHWKQGKAMTVKAIDLQLRRINSKWKLSSLKPTPSDEDGESYYSWSTVDAKKDTTAQLALYVLEDETSVKYTLRYAFYGVTNYQSLVQSLKTDPYYKGSVWTQSGTVAKGERDVGASADDSLPLNKRADCRIADYDFNSNDKHRLFTIDIMSRYIPK